MSEELQTYMNHCLKNGVRIYPVRVRGSWYLEVDNRGKKRRGRKVVSSQPVLRGKKLNKALEPAYKYYSDKLKNLT